MTDCTGTTYVQPDPEMTLRDLLDRMEAGGEGLELVSEQTLPRFFWGQAARLGEAHAEAGWFNPAALALTRDCAITIGQGPDPIALDWWAGEDEGCGLGHTVRIGAIHLAWILEEEGERALYIAGELTYETAPPQLLELAMAAWRLRGYGVVLPVQLETDHLISAPAPHPAAPLLPHVRSFTLTGLALAYPPTFVGAGIVLSDERLGPVPQDPRVTMLFASGDPLDQDEDEDLDPVDEVAGDVAQADEPVPAATA